MAPLPPPLSRQRFPSIAPAPESPCGCSLCGAPPAASFGRRQGVAGCDGCCYRQCQARYRKLVYSLKRKQISASPSLRGACATSTGRKCYDVTAKCCARFVWEDHPSTTSVCVPSCDTARKRQTVYRRLVIVSSRHRRRTDLLFRYILCSIYWRHVHRESGYLTDLVVQVVSRRAQFSHFVSAW